MKHIHFRGRIIVFFVHRGAHFVRFKTEFQTSQTTNNPEKIGSLLNFSFKFTQFENS
jgi:hypothetical protein